MSEIAEAEIDPREEERAQRRTGAVAVFAVLATLLGRA